MTSTNPTGSNSGRKLNSKQRAHKTHYSRIKSSAITASYRLAQKATENVLIQLTAKAATDGLRPHVVQSIQGSNDLKDVIGEELYSHNPRDS